MTLPYRTGAATFATAAMITVGCSSPESETDGTTKTSTITQPGLPESYQPPDQVRDATMIWSAEPGIDLFDERGRLIRAAEEARTIANFGGYTTTYPGFVNVVSPEDVMNTVTRQDQTLVGTIRTHILSISETDSGFEATLCDQPSHYAVRASTGRYQRWNYPAGDFTARFDHAPDRESGPLPTLAPVTAESVPGLDAPPIQDPGAPEWQAPVDDLFAGTDWMISFGGGSRESEQVCQVWGGQFVVESHRNEYSYYTDTPPVTFPAYPGW